MGTIFNRLYLNVSRDRVSESMSYGWWRLLDRRISSYDVRHHHHALFVQAEYQFT